MYRKKKHNASHISVQSMSITVIFLISIILTPQLSRINEGNTYHQYRYYDKLPPEGSSLRLGPCSHPYTIPFWLLSLQPPGESLGRWKGRRTTVSPWGRAPIASFRVTTAFSHTESSQCHPALPSSSVSLHTASTG